MNKTLKTFPDGSEITVLGAVATAAATLVLGGVSAYVTVKISDWNYNRKINKIVKKYI